MTPAPQPLQPENVLGWRTELQEALAQTALSAFEGDSSVDPERARRAAYRLAAALGKCRLFGVDLGDQDGSLLSAVGLAAVEQWVIWLEGWAKRARRLGDHWDRSADEVEALDRSLDLLLARMESWAVFLAVDEAYQACLEPASSIRDRFAVVLDQALGRLADFDSVLQENIPLLLGTTKTRLLENWRRLLAPEYRVALPWWLDSSLEEAAKELEHEGPSWQPRPRAGSDRQADATKPLTGPRIDFTSDAEVVRLVVEGQRLAFGHLANPAFAIETALIEPLPHQRIAVYQHLLRQPRLRFLLADDAGAGKTIMAGLYVREMLSRRLLRRVLVVPPAGLVGNWKRELSVLFDLEFDIVAGAEARTGNPFLGPDSDLLIVSVDTLTGEKMFARLRESSVEPYDLIIFDEAHKLAADRQEDFTVRKTERYKLAEALAGAAAEEGWSLPWACQHLLLLTATPHMGKDYPYYALWRLLEPEALPTFDAFLAYPSEQRQRRFLRRTKEEMVRFDGSHIYPTRVSTTLSYDLTQGDVSEQALYDQTTDYIRLFYNKADVLNRSAARLAMSIFQRRLASSTFALLRSFERRLAKLDALIAAIKARKLALTTLSRSQETLSARYALDGKTADEEETQRGREENEVEEEQALGAVTAVNLDDLVAERDQVRALLELARQVDAKGDESKFERLKEAIQDPRYRHEKVLLFTEHRDTLEFLVRRLEGQGFTGQIAQIHGGMDYREREEQVAAFRKKADQGGARFLVATDAAGEGINLQFCWLMVNYDIPWNPARLEQRMGRVHRYGQKHDPVIILNLIAGKTREGRVLQTLLSKLDTIRKELQSDKVFDVVGRLLEGVSIRQYMEEILSDSAAARLEQRLTSQHVKELGEDERKVYGQGNDVLAQLRNQTDEVERERWRKLLPGYVRRFVAHAAPRLGLTIDGELDRFFSLRPGRESPAALRSLLAPYGLRSRPLTLSKPADVNGHVFLRPGEPVFDRLRDYFCEHFADSACRGGVFVDPDARRSYLFHLALVSVVRRSEPRFPAFRRAEPLEYRLLGLRHEEGGQPQPCSPEQLLLLRGGDGVPPSAWGVAAAAEASRSLAETALAEAALGQTRSWRQRLQEDLGARLNFVTLGYSYQEAELAAARSRLAASIRKGNTRARDELERVKKRQQELDARKGQALAALRCEPELVGPGEVIFLAHALVVPSADPEDRKRHDEQVEATAVRLAWAFEQSAGGNVQDVSTPEGALRAGLGPHPGFDLLSIRAEEQRRAIEVKGRAFGGEVELTENEWVQACNHRNRYWLYVVYGCATSQPRLLRIQDPFSKLLVRPRTRVAIDEGEIVKAAEREGFDST